MLAGLLLTVVACERTPLDIGGERAVGTAMTRHADAESPVAVTTLLDSLTVGGVYTVLPVSGFSGLSYPRPSERLLYANPIRNYPTGIALPVGLPVRVLAEGAVTSRPTAAFASAYCALYGAMDTICAASSYTYTVHGIAPGINVTYPYELSTGLSVRWKRLGSASAASYPSPEFFRGVIPPPDSLAEYAELYFTRAAGCCFYLPFSGTEAWETYDGRWRFGVAMDDGGRPEAGVPAALQLMGERTDAPMAAPADFTLSAVDGGLLSSVRWWFIQPMANTFNGDSVPFVREPPPSTFTLPVPRYPDAQRTTVAELTECATQVTCRYQAPAAGAVVAMATLADGRVLGARATPALACGVAGVSGLRAAGRSLAAECEPPAPPTLKLECPSSITRGEKIACGLWLSDATLPFSVSEIDVYATPGTSAFSIVLSAPGPIAAGAVYRMEGPAVATTRLSAKGTVAWRGQTLNLVDSTSFVVKERPRELDEYVMTLAPKADGPGRTTKFPSTNRGGSTLGLYRRQPPLFDSLQIATAATGPNRGLSYVASVPGIPASLINLTFAIFPGDPWYEAHPVQLGPLNDAGVLICTRSKIDDLRLQAERHEGMTLASNSHYGLDQAFLRRVKLGAFIGAHVINVAGSPDQIRRQMALELMQEWSREDAYLWTLQRAFDAKDVPAMLAALGCSIYLKD